MKYGDALEHLKRGGSVARAGWNGKGMFVYLNKGSVAEANRFELIGGVHSSLFETGARGTVTRMPNFNMRAADGSIVTGWLASQTDMLAEDWVIADA